MSLVELLKTTDILPLPSTRLVTVLNM